MQDDPGFEGIDHIKEHVESWQDVPPERVKVRRLSGLSNKIYKVSAHDKSVYPKTVIYREFGEGAAICDRKRENYVIKTLAKKKIAPMFYGGDEQHRVEKFSHGEELTKSDFKENPVRRKLANLMASLHLVKLEKLNKTPMFVKILEEKTLINEFQEKADRENVYSPVEQKFISDIKKLISEEEIAFLKKIAPEQDEKTVVFSHNDLHAGNVLRVEKTEKLLFIDFEYSDYNFRGYDLANLFNETMFEYDVAKHPHYIYDATKYPKDEELLDFIKYYLFFKEVAEADIDTEAAYNDDKYRDSYIEKNLDLKKFNKEADELFEEVKLCEIFSHYFWCLWAVIQSHNEDMNFDYMHYAYKRYELYQEAKEKQNLKKSDKDEPIDKDTAAP